MDNASVMKAAANIITTKYGHMYFQGCTLYAMNLFLGDLAKAKWITNVLKKAKTIVKFIKKTPPSCSISKAREEVELSDVGEN